MSLVSNHCRVVIWAFISFSFSQNMCIVSPFSLGTRNAVAVSADTMLMLSVDNTVLKLTGPSANGLLFLHQQRALHVSHACLTLWQ